MSIFTIINKSIVSKQVFKVDGQGSLLRHQGGIENAY